VDSHSRALAHAEVLFGDPRARRSLVHLFVGNVVDAALATGGTVHHGPRAGAGDVAHLPLGEASVRCPCGRTGCVQAAVSEAAAANRAADLGIVPAPDFNDLLDAAASGDRRADALLRRRARLTGRAVALLLDVVNPEVLVLTDQSLILSPHYLPEVHEEVRAHSHVCDDPEEVVVPSSFGTDVLGVAAGAVVLADLYQRPLTLLDSPLNPQPSSQPNSQPDSLPAPPPAAPLDPPLDSHLGPPLSSPSQLPQGALP
jgi:predicted NBD/HSP70 family sugar kinase